MDYLVADRLPRARGGRDSSTASGSSGCPTAAATRAMTRPDYSPPVGPPPAVGRGYVTFGSFNNPAKVNPEVVATWAEILRAACHAIAVAPEVQGPRRRRDAPAASTETLPAPGGIDPGSPGRAGGLDPACCEPRGLQPRGRRPRYVPLRRQHHDLRGALDGRARRHGWPGATFASRHGLSYLSSIGLADLVGRDLAQYVEIAVSLAGDMARLAGLRAGLRTRMADSPLCDADRFARNLVDALREVWRGWCRERS